MTRAMLTMVAAAIVCATNLGALVLASINRSGTPDAEVTLTERELNLTHTSESTATTLRIAWVQRFDRTGEWLTCPKLQDIGVTCTPRDDSLSRWFARQPLRRAYVVLEYDGPQWQAFREAERRRMEEAARTYGSTAPVDADAVLNGYSRLVAIDVGPDPGALRNRYPDGHRYLVVDGRISIYGHNAGNAAPYLSGTVSAVSPPTINVPHPYSSLFTSMDPSSYSRSEFQRPRYWVTLRYGRFHEPWIVNAGLAAR